MREPPDLANSAIVAALDENYGIAVQALSFLPLGADSASAAYRVQDVRGVDYFLKVRARDGFSVASLTVPRFLASGGVSHVHAPLPARSGALWVRADQFVLSLFLFIAGRRVADVGMPERQWAALGATLKRIHTCRLPPDLMQVIPREVFTPTRRQVLARLESAIERQRLGDPAQRALADFWMARREELRALVERADELGRDLRRGSAPLVLCHADLHTWNLLLDASQQIWIVDWDETILAMKERDLMFVVGGIGPDQVRGVETASFMQGYGDVQLDPLALTYYRYAWAVQDMAAYGEQVFFLPGLTQATRQDALKGFMNLFEPGEIVSIALGSVNEVQPHV